MAGHVKSCGCSRKGKGRKFLKPYSNERGRLYLVWNGMKTRCLNKNFRQYKDYGGRGIKVCDEWMNYADFQTWALESGYDENAPRGQCTLQRIDNDGDYCPSNCCWVPLSEQFLNRRPKSK